MVQKLYEHFKGSGSLENRWLTLTATDIFTIPVARVTWENN